MTNSTDNSAPDKTPKKSKKAKKKGPIRFEAIVPIAIIIGLIVLYFTLFFDIHLRKGLEWSGTYIHGAEVNIADIDISFLEPSFKLKGLQVTDKDKPEQNLFQIEEIRFGLIWDALLRAKFVVKEAAIQNIQALVPRERPGRVLPPSDKRDDTVAKLEQGVLNQAEEEFSGNVLGDIAKILQGTNAGEQLKNIQSQLKAEGRIKELEAELKKKEAEWKERLDKLPQKKELDQLVKRAESIKVDFKNPVKAAKDIKAIEELIKEAKEKIKYFETTGRSLDQDIKGFDKSFSQLDKLIEQDIKDLQKRLNIPNLDVGDFSKSLFGNVFKQRVASARKYMAVARDYMPPKKEKQEEPTIAPRARQAGIDVRFPITKGYPTFWLQKALISSEPSSSEYSGRLSGQIIDVTSNPPALGRPAVATLVGDFPKQNIMGLDAKLTINHVTNEPYEKLVATIGHYPLEARTLASGSDVNLAISGAKGEADIEAVLKNQQLHIKVQNRFKEVGYDIKAKSALVQELLEKVVNDIPVVTINSIATGSWDRINWNINSNLGRELSQGLQKHIKAKVEQAQRELRAFVENRINSEKGKLTSEYNKIKGQVDKLLGQKKKELDQAKKQAEGELDKKKSQALGGKKQQKELEKAGKKALDDLKKGLGF